MNRRNVLRTIKVAAISLAVGSVFGISGPVSAADKPTIRLNTIGSATDRRSVAMVDIFGPAIKDFANFEPHFNSTLFKQGSEIEAMARGNLDMAITSAQELAEFFPEFSVLTAGYLLKSAEHQKKVFNADFMQPLKDKVENELGVKLLAIFYLGRRQLNLRTDGKVMTPEDLSGVKLRMPGTEGWQFLGKALGANPVPMAFTEVYTALQTGAIDGQDNPLPTVKDRKFYEVTKQIILTSHLVDQNYLAISMKAWNTFSPEQQARLQKAADDATDSAREKQLALEAELEQFFKDQGLKVYTPDVEAFRRRVQKMYLESPYSKDWPKGMVDKINAL